MKLPLRLLTTALALVLCTNAAKAVPQAQDGAPLAEPSKSLYWQGHEALGRNDWREALDLFRRLEKEQDRSQVESSDAAIYWQAYALTQARRPREAGIEIERLRRLHPDSAWLDDAETLAPGKTGTQKRDADSAADSARDAERNDRASGRHAEARDPREADALMALDALLVGGNQKAVPVLQKVLAGEHGDRVKSRAIFVLSQIDPVAADEALQSVLAGNASPRLKTEAIRMIAAGGRRTSLDRLLPVYRASADRAVKRGVLDAFLIGDRGDLLQQVIATEADAKTRQEAIAKLGAMGRESELEQLYAGRSEPGDRRAILQALGVAGARDVLATLARSESDAALRAEALRSIAIAGGKDAPALLLGFYRPAEPERVRRAVIDALMIAGATDALVQLYRQETDEKMKRELLNRITASDADAALELIDRALQH
jgi:hypothetical protein